MEVIVIGGGLSGLTTAWFVEREAARRGVVMRVKVLEACGRVGGKISTQRRDGFLVEEAAAGWLATSPAVADLCDALDLGDDVVSASAQAQRRYVVRGGRLREISPNPVKLVSSGVLSAAGALRAACEPWIARGAAADESVADFARRRIGKQALERLIDPAVSGVFAGDPEQLSWPAAYPRFAALEQEHGSLVRAFLKRDKRAPRGGLLSLRGGVEQLTGALRGGLATPPTVGAPVSAIGRARGAGARYVVRRGDGARFLADHVIVATPAHVAAVLLEGLDDQLARELLGIPYASVAVVALGFLESALPEPFSGFGFLAPERENRAVLGTLFESNVFAGRAPPGAFLTRSMVGGARHPERARWPEGQLIAASCRELQELVGVTESPVFAWVKRHARALPQYVVGHGARMQRIDGRLAALPGLWLTGNAYRGVSVSDIVASSAELARRVAEQATAQRLSAASDNFDQDDRAPTAAPSASASAWSGSPRA